MAESKRKLINFRVSPELHTALKTFACYKDWTINTLLINAVNNELDNIWKKLMDPNESTDQEYRKAKARGFIKAYEQLNKEITND